MYKDRIKELLAYLKREQQLNGSFLSYSSPTAHNFEKAKPYKTVFTTALILLSLDGVDSPLSLKIKKRAAEYLHSQKSKNWTFNYWDRKSEEYSSMPYPDDLDDTFCSLAALQMYDKTIINGDVLAKAISTLTALEKREGGPYKTWIVTDDVDDVWKDVDLAVNSNIGYFLSLHDIELPQITKLVEKSIINKTFSSPYYPSPFPIIYFISRWYKGGKKKALVNFISNELRKNRDISPLDKICANIALLNLDQTHDSFMNKSIDYLSKLKPEPHTFYTGINPKRDTKYFAGSGALTTALTIEMLAKFDHMKLAQLEKQQKSVNKDVKAINIHKQVLQKVEKRFKGTTPEAKKIFTSILDKLRKTDKDVQIILLPYLYFTTLKKHDRKLPRHFFVQLGAANLYGWIAYTIYDDFLDDEGKPPTLSVANMCLRELTSIFESILPEKTGFKKIFHSFMDIIDAANTWETTYCRSNKIPFFGDRSQLADKSIGHALGPIAVLYALGYDKNDTAVKKAVAFFKHYIIARQLNDDAHDWKDDLKAGQINSVGAMVLTIAAKKNIKRTHYKKLEKIFWDEVVIDVSKLMLKHAKKAQELAESNFVIQHTRLYEKLLAPIVSSANKTLDEQKKAQEFISSF